MSNRLAVLLGFFLFASSAGALTVISMTPTGGTVGGGDVITIHVEQVPACDPSACFVTVSFGDVLASSIDANEPGTLRVTTPPHQHGIVKVTVSYGGLTASAGNFEFVDLNLPPVRANYEVVLVPIVVQSQPINGAFGSRWTSELWAHNRSASRVELFNGLPQCMLASPVGCLNIPFPGIFPGNTASLTTPAFIPAQAFLYYLQRGHDRDVSFSLRVRDLSRTLDNAGTEIPLGRESAFSADRVELLNVPIEDTSRTSLRIYNIDGGVSRTAEVRLLAMDVDGTLIAKKSVSVTRTTGQDELGEFKNSAGVAFIADLRSELGNPPAGHYRIEVAPDNFEAWALATITNNTTQLVTAIAP
jgi:hypothetical protein